MMDAFKLLSALFILGMYFFIVLRPHKTLLQGNALSLFNFVDKILNPVFSLLRKFFKPKVIGTNISIDTAPIVLLIILLTILIYIK